MPSPFMVLVLKVLYALALVMVDLTLGLLYLRLLWSDLGYCMPSPFNLDTEPA